MAVKLAELATVGADVASRMVIGNINGIEVHTPCRDAAGEDGRQMATLAGLAVTGLSAAAGTVAQTGGPKWFMYGNDLAAGEISGVTVSKQLGAIVVVANVSGARGIHAIGFEDKAEDAYLGNAVAASVLIGLPAQNAPAGDRAASPQYGAIDSSLEVIDRAGLVGLLDSIRGLVQEGEAIHFRFG